MGFPKACQTSSARGSSGASDNPPSAEAHAPLVGLQRFLGKSVQSRCLSLRLTLSLRAFKRKVCGVVDGPHNHGGRWAQQLGVHPNSKTRPRQCLINGRSTRSYGGASHAKQPGFRVFFWGGGRGGGNTTRTLAKICPPPPSAQCGAASSTTRPTQLGFCDTAFRLPQFRHTVPLASTVGKHLGETVASHIARASLCAGRLGRRAFGVFGDVLLTLG